MKKPDVTIGVIIIGIELVGVSLGFAYISSLQSYNIYGLPISEFIRTMDASVNQQYQNAQIMLYGGGITAIVGLVLAIYGFMAESDKEKEEAKINTKRNRRKEMSSLWKNYNY